MVGSVLFGTLLIFDPWWGPSYMGLNNLTHGGVRPLWDLLIFNPWWGPSSLGLNNLTHGGVRPLWDFISF